MLPFVLKTICENEENYFEIINVNKESKKMKI